MFIFDIHSENLVFITKDLLVMLKTSFDIIIEIVQIISLDNRIHNWKNITANSIYKNANYEKLTLGMPKMMFVIFLPCKIS
jgi:hypothetical protein